MVATSPHNLSPQSLLPSWFASLGSVLLACSLDAGELWRLLSVHSSSTHPVAQHPHPTLPHILLQVPSEPLLPWDSPLRPSPPPPTIPCQSQLSSVTFFTHTSDPDNGSSALSLGSPGATSGKESTRQYRRLKRLKSCRLGRSPGGGCGTILAWRIP